MDVLRQRLGNVKSSLGDNCESTIELFEFVREDDETQRSNGQPCDDINVVPVKTLIWEAEILPQCRPEETSRRVLHFATALCHQNRVDEDALKQVLCENLPTSLSTNKIEVVSLKLAETTKAEELAGYMSGTIPPFGHTTPLLLIVDRALLGVSVVGQHDSSNSNDNGNILTTTTSTTKQPTTTTGTTEQRMLSTGSGSFRHSLLIRWDHMLHIAKVLGNDVCVASISTLLAVPQQQQQQTGTHRDNTSYSATDRSSQDSNFVGLNTVNNNIDDHDNNDDNDEDGNHGPPYKAVPISEEMQSLGRLLRDSALREGKAKVIRTVISQAGDRFPQLVQMGTGLNYSRNSIHLAAWKSDVESIQLLLDAGKRYGLDDLVNIISTGRGNYGKTPIFYAINQGRDEMVKHLIDCGANLLIVNRNGNTPCSLASSKGQLSPETCELLEKVRAEQLQAGGTFDDYNINTSIDEQRRHCATGLPTEQGAKVAEEQIESMSQQQARQIMFGETDSDSPSLKSLSKMLRDAAGKKNKSALVHAVIEQAGDDFPIIVEVGTDGNFTKNALHLAAWKGDPESIKLLINAGTKYGLDLVNVISVGEGNYGKTPVFYAITQNRDDVVKLFIDHGADLLIVNNKGQTPCSMAVTHLQPDTCQYMFNKEYDQIQSGKKFQNYRISHGDSKQYGDLDPRFKIDEINHGVDIVDGLETYHETLRATTGHDVALDGSCYKNLPASFLPRSLRPTTKSERQGCADKLPLKKSLCARKIHCSNLPTVAAVLNGVTEKNDPQDKPRREGEAKSTKLQTKETKKDIENLPQLFLTDLLVDDTTGDQAFVIDQESHIPMLSDEVARTIEQSRRNQESPEVLDRDLDNRLLHLSWGLDCEWKPSRDHGREYPAATLQLSSFRRTFLVDLQQLCQGGVKDPLTPMSSTEKKICETLAQLFGNPNIPVLGFGIGGDLTKLAVSFPHIPCFQSFHATIDLDVLFHNSFPQSLHNDLRSLQKSVACLLHKCLSKTEQCSNWQQRPLTANQIQYAALDAAVLPHLLQEALASYNTRNQRTLRGFFSKYPHLLVSWRFAFLDEKHIETSLSHRSAYTIDHGTIRNLLSLWYAQQSWQTGKTEPPLPFPTPLELQLDQLEIREDKEAKKVEPKQKTKVQRQEKRKKVPLQLATVSIATLPISGQYLGYTKESCILELLSKSVISSLEENFYLGFNRRGGIVQMKDAWLLFVYFGGGKEKRKFANKFSGRGRFMSFSISPRKDLDGLFYDNVSVGYHGQDTSNLPVDTKLILFARPDSGSQYIFCGECSCVGEEASNGGIDLLLEMTSFEALESTDYMTMVG